MKYFVLRKLLLSVSALALFEPSLAPCAELKQVPPDLPTQPQPKPEAATGSTGTTNSIPAPGDIIVTANRRAESLQKTPIAVTALSETQLRTSNLVDTRDIVRLAPTLGFTEAVGARSSSFYLRGIGTFSTAESFDNSVGTAIDGIPAGRNSTAFADLVDVERVEVLEGPQGLLFGRNASAGLINIINNKPKIGETSFTGRLGYGNFNQRQITGALNYSLSDKVAIRATGWNFAHDGYIDAPFQGRKLGKRDDLGVRLGARIDPVENLDILLTAQATRANNDPFAPSIRKFLNNANGVEAVETAEGLQAGPNNRRDDTTASLRYDTRDQNYSGVANYSLGGVTLTSTTAYEHFTLNDAHDSSATNAPPQVLQTETQRIKQFSQELRITSPGNTRLRYVAGLFYFDLRDYDYPTVTYFNTYFLKGTPITVSSASAPFVRSRSYALFGQFTYDLLPALRLIAGGRYSHDKIDGSVVRTIPATQLIIPGLTSPGAANGALNVSSTISDTEPSWRGGLQYDAARDVMVYATVSHGYKAAGLDLGGNVTAAAFSINQAHVLPEKATNYEAGIRSQLFDRHLTLNATVFREVFRNFQVATVFTGPPLTTLTQNAPRITSTGATVQAAARLSRELNLSANVAYVDAKFTDFPDAQCYAGEPAGTAGSGPGSCVGGSQNLAGKRLPNAPRWTALVGADMHHDVSSALTLFGSVNYRYQSEVNFNLNQDPLSVQGGYSLVNLTAGIRSIDERWSIRGYANNLFHTQFVSRILPGINYYSNINSYGSERTFGAVLDVRL